MRLDVEVPLPDQLADDQLAVLFPGIDGAWGRLARDLLAHHGARGLDLNEPWASAPPWWTCPGCRRTKPQIAVVSSANVLLCHLHRHHDHCVDLIDELIRAQFGADASRTFAVFGHLVRGSQKMVERFPPTLLCPQCNTADGDAKQLIGVHRHFSFSPGEIAQFVVPVANARRHEIRREVAAALWEAGRPAHETRVRLVESHVEVIASGLLNRIGGSEHPSMFQQASMEGYLSDSLLRADKEAWETIRSSLTAVRSRAVSGGNRGLSKPVEQLVPTKSGPEPSAEVLAALNGGVYWECADAPWRCPGCGRLRNETVRFNPKKCRWVGFIHQVVEHGFENDALVRHHYLICRDCSDACSIAKQRAGNDIRPSMAGLRAALVVALPHTQAVFDPHLTEEASRGHGAWLAQHREDIAAFESECEISYATGRSYGRGLLIDGTDHTASVYAAYMLFTEDVFLNRVVPPFEEALEIARSHIELAACVYPHHYRERHIRPADEAIERFRRFVEARWS